MPGKKQFKEQADEGFLRAAYDHLADIRLGAGVITSLELVPTKRKGVFEIVITGHAHPSVWATGGPVAYRREWPRAEVATLAAAVFQAVTAFDVLLGQEIASEGWTVRDDPWKE